MTINPLLDFRVNWDSSYRISYEFKTDMVVSRSGREQRRGLRETPRKSLEYRSLLTGDELRRFNRLMSSQHGRSIDTFEATRSAVTVAPLAAGVQTATLADVPTWLVAGTNVALVDRGRAISATVLEVDDNTVTFVAPVGTNWPVGTKIHPRLTGYLAQQIRVPHTTNTTATATIRFDVDPASEPVGPATAAPDVFNGQELLLIKPNWISDINWTYEHETEVVDYGRGRTARFLPIEFETRMFEASYLARSRAEVQSLTDFFTRMLGQVGEFYMPTWNADLSPRATAFSGANTIRLIGSSILQTYENDRVHRAITIMMRDGRRLFRKVVDMYGVTDATGSDTVFLVDSIWPFQIKPEDVLMICWLPRWRSATDTLTIEWITDNVAQTKLSLKTIEDIPLT